MRTRIKGAAVIGTAAGVEAVRRLLERSPVGWLAPGRKDSHRWRVVTVNLPLEQVGEAPPGPLSFLADEIEVRVSPAPGDKGTEIAARLTGGGDRIDGEDPVETLRRALRETKMLLEVGWVLEPDANTSTRPTPLNAPLRSATARARGEGRL